MRASLIRTATAACCCRTASRAPPGAQGFPGYRPADASNTHRTAVGAYIDLEANVTKQFLASAAVRAEHYSDFGNSLAGKLAARYDFTPALALRGSVQNGFRAPSPQQQNFSATSTNFINGVPFDITTFRPTDPVAAALGAKPLDAEKSLNLSLGAVDALGQGQPDGRCLPHQDQGPHRAVGKPDRIDRARHQQLPESARLPGSGGGRFFINGVDTTTDGVDVVLNVPMNADERRQVRPHRWRPTSTRPK